MNTSINRAAIIDDPSSIPEGQYSAGSIQVRAIDGNNFSDVRPLGPIIIPYTPANLNITVLGSSKSNVIYRISGIGQIGGIVDLFTPDNLEEPTDYTIINTHGYFQFLVDYQLVESEPDEPDEPDEPVTTHLQGYFLRMKDPEDDDIVSNDIPLDQTITTYTFTLGTIPVSNTVNIVPSSQPFIYSLDGGDTWSGTMVGTNSIPIEPRLYPPGMIRIRALDDYYLPTGPSYSAGGTISPYIFGELDTKRIDIGEPAVTSLVIRGTGDIGSTISLTNDDEPEPPIATTEVDPYGQFTITVPVADLDPDDSYSITMRNSVTDLETTQPFDIPNSNPPEAKYVLDGSIPPIPEISVVDDGRTIQYTTNGGLKWNPFPPGP